MIKQLGKELFEIKEDLLNCTKKCNKKYHIWLDKNTKKILPAEYKHSYYFDINNCPQKYLKYMIYMNSEIEKYKGKCFQFSPLRTEITPKYIPIDTKSIIELFMNSDKKKYLDDIENNKYEIWNKYFKLDHKIFGCKNYKFNYRILTDNYSTSVELIHEDFIEKDHERKINIIKCKKLMKEKCKDLTSEEKETYKNLYKETKKKEYTKKRLEMKKKYKELSKEDKEKFQVGKYIEFPYLEELNNKQIEDLKKSNKIYVDPGKRALLYMLGDNGTILTYTNKQRIKETKRLLYQHKIQNYKNNNEIIFIENKLNEFNSKTCNVSKFKKYIKNKNKINEELFSKYEAKIFRRYKWYSYINKKRSDDKLLTRIEKTYGKATKIIIGDWSVSKQMRNFISTPNMWLKRKLATKFDVYNIDEYNTSCLNNKTEEKCENLYLPDLNGKIRKIHSILSYKMDNNRYGCINRDKNAVFNFCKIVKHFLTNGDRPLKYLRDYKPIKDRNP